MLGEFKKTLLDKDKEIGASWEKTKKEEIGKKKNAHTEKNDEENNL